MAPSASQLAQRPALPLLLLLLPWVVPVATPFLRGFPSTSRRRGAAVGRRSDRWRGGAVGRPMSLLLPAPLLLLFCSSHRCVVVVVCSVLLPFLDVSACFLARRCEALAMEYSNPSRSGPSDAPIVGPLYLRVALSSLPVLRPYSMLREDTGRVTPHAPHASLRAPAPPLLALLALAFRLARTRSRPRRARSPASP